MTSSDVAAELNPVRVPKTAELVAGHLRRQIVRGELHEGDALPPEAELMEQFGVSRPTLREAYRVLESESLITVRRGSRGGARVHLPDSSVAGRYAGLLLQVRGATLDDVFLGRLVIEQAAARRAARRTDGEAAERLRAALAVEAELTHEPPRFAQAANAFHDTLVVASGSQTLEVLYATITEVVASTVSHFLAAPYAGDDQPAENERAVKAHQRLIDLIAAGDAAGAETFWAGHMEIVRRVFLDLYGSTTVVELLS